MTKTLPELIKEIDKAIDLLVSYDQTQVAGEARDVLIEVYNSLNEITTIVYGLVE